jgi:hypothetical protein
MEQAEDRVHRIGQKHPVLVDIIVYDNTIDAHMLKTLSEKKSIISGALDGPCAKTRSPNSHGTPGQADMKAPTADKARKTETATANSGTDGERANARPSLLTGGPSLGAAAPNLQQTFPTQTELERGIAR